MLRETRRQEILATLHAHGPVEVADLSTALGVSETTIRRDLTELADEGRLRRVHGGAIAMRAEEGDEPFQEVAQVNSDAKQAIARACGTLVEDGQTVILDIGTTCAQIAQSLRGRSLTVVTSSLAVVDVLIEDTECEVIVLGGSLRREYRSLVGFQTEQSLADLRADVAFIGTSGVRDNGDVLDTTVAEVPIKRAMIAAAARRILVADAAKFPGRGAARVAGPECFHDLVTTGSLALPTRRAFTDAAVTIHEV